MLDAKRPFSGIAPNNIDNLIGRKIKRNIDEDEIIFEIDLE